MLDSLIEVEFLGAGFSKGRKTREQNKNSQKKNN